MMNPVMNMPGTWGTIGSTLLTVIFFWDMLRRYCPPELRRYLSLNSSKHAKRLKAEMTKDNDSKLMLSMDEYERTTDEFNGVQVKWISGKVATPPRPMLFSYFPEPEKRYYKLKFHKQYKEMITETYLELEAHPLFQSVAELIKAVDITPADVAENLMPKSAKEGPEECLLNLIHALEEAKSRQITKCTEELKYKDPYHDRCSTRKA